MSVVKAALKAARTALEAEKYDEAISQARIVLASDPQNYFGYVLFLLGHDQSLIHPQSGIPWQGSTTERRHG
jgi:two-component SAPR family response regulator